MQRKSAEKYAIISVFDKTGIADFAKTLLDLNYKIISSGGTAKILLKNNIKVIPVQEITKNPECFDGRMKTISFQIESGILFDRAKLSHRKEAKKLGIKLIDIVVCNLYPFEKTVANPKVSLNDTIENIDVGGPTMIRAAAKNFQNVLVIIDPQDYSDIASVLHSDKILETKRKELAAKAFRHLSFYDSQIARFLGKEDLFPNEITIPGRKAFDLRYGENPHQKASLYFEPNARSSLKNLKRLWGRELSLVNVADINAGLMSVGMFEEPVAVVIKHNGPCGIALGKTINEALKRAIAGDPESTFGGIIVLNKPIDLKTSKVIGNFKKERQSNIDIVAAPNIDKKAFNFLTSIRKSMGIYTFGQILKKFNIKTNLKPLEGGFILQTLDNPERSFPNWTFATVKKPTKKQLEQVRIGWKFISRIRSNSVIVIDKNLPMTRGIGSGQTSRFRSTKIALEQAGKYAKSAILISDSFFPFDDGIKLAAKYGISAILQQGGSVNDKASIKAANDSGITMVFTHARAFWH